jgi:polysaccharide export outer membrane protein
MRFKSGSCSLATGLLGSLLLCQSVLSVQAQAAAKSAPVSTASASGLVDNGDKGGSAEIASTKTADIPVSDTVKASEKRAIDAPGQTTLNDPLDPSYIVGIADELQISVWKEPDLSMPVVVRPDGMITLPVIDDIKVVGLTTKQVQDVLTDKLKNVVSDPQVTVIVRNIRSRKVYLVGQVGHPGAVTLNGKETILQVLAESGGPGPYAKSDKIYILRNTDGRQEKLTFNYKKAVKGGDPSSDIPLKTGDVIVVP